MSGTKVITSSRVCQIVIQDLFDGVNEGNVSIPLSNAWEGLQDAIVLLGLAMQLKDRRQLTRYSFAVQMSRRKRKRVR